MNTQQLTYVLAVAECRSFSKAAEKLYVTQPSLSQYIHGIEKQLGMKLFDRTLTPIRLTDAGELYVEWARRLLAMEEGMVNALNDLMEMGSGSVELGASSFRIRCLLAKSIAVFHERYPAIRLSIREAEMGTLRELLLSGTLNFAIGTGQFDHKQFHVEPLAEERLYLAVSPRNPICESLPQPLTEAQIRQQDTVLLRCEEVSFEQMQDSSFVAAMEGEYDLESLSDVCRKCGFIPKIGFRVETIETVFSFVCANMGIALLPDSLIRYGNFKEHPNYYMLPDSIGESSISLISKRNAYLPKAAAAYALLLKQLVDVGTWRVGALEEGGMLR